MLKGANLKGGSAPAPPIDQPPLFPDAELNWI